MHEWGCHYPDELRVRLELALEHAAELEAENERLSALLRQAGVDPETAPNGCEDLGAESARRSDDGSRPQSTGGPGVVTAHSPTEVKIAGFPP